MKTLLTIIAALCITTTTFAQTVIKKEAIIEISDQEKERIQNVITELSEKLQASLKEKETWSKNDITSLKELLEKIDHTNNIDDVRKKIIIKSSDDSNNTSISYAFNLDADEEVTILDGLEALNLDDLKEKLTELSISINDSDALKLLAKKLKEKHAVIVKEIEEKEEKSKH